MVIHMVIYMVIYVHMVIHMVIHMLHLLNLFPVTCVLYLPHLRF